jgi:hypothetical protein
VSGADGRACEISIQLFNSDDGGKNVCCEFGCVRVIESGGVVNGCADLKHAQQTAMVGRTTL